MTARHLTTIVGTGHAAVKAAETLREQGYDGRVVLVGAEPELPYDRPALSKGYLTGGETREGIRQRNEQWYADHDIELVLGVAAGALEPATRRLVLGDGSVLRYDRLLLATGAIPRRLPVPGADLAGVHYLRGLADADALRADLTGGGRRVVVVGGGWIGLETAAAARTLGNDVTVVEPQPSPLFGVLGADLGGFFAGLHAAHGVELRCSTGATALVGRRGRVTAVATSDGSLLPADVVVAGVGATPAVGLAAAAGLPLAGGVRVDTGLRTGAPGVYAAGDVATIDHPTRGAFRVEHWQHARATGAAAARSMLGQDVDYDETPFFFSDQYDLGMEYTGFAPPGTVERIVVRGDVDARRFIAFFLAGDRLLAGMNVNVWDVADPIRALVERGGPISPAELADTAVPLEEIGLAPAGAGRSER